MEFYCKDMGKKGLMLNEIQVLHYKRRRLKVKLYV
jgi:hypothetical protein